MGRFTFVYNPEIEGQATVGVTVDDTDPHISSVVNAFRQFLLGVTFQPATIAKYIDVDLVDSDLVERAK